MGSYIGIDIGTTHIKTGRIDAKGDLVALQKAPTPVTRKDGREYYEPQALFELVMLQLNKVLESGSEVCGIGITGMAEAGLVLDKESMQELSQIIPWYDSCTIPLAQRLSKDEEQELFYWTGLRNSFKYGIYKYLWCLEQFHLESRNTIWLSVCDYMFYRLTGAVITEPTFAARTYVYNIRNKCWDKKSLERVGLTEENFPGVVPSGMFAGTLKATKIPVALCGHDHICSAFALLENEDQLCNSCGTAETFVGKISSLPEVEQSSLVYGPYVDGFNYFGMANLSSSGQSVEWVRKQLQQREISYREINEYLAAIDKKPGDILFFPYLSGMGSPLFQPDCGGAFLGLRAEHRINQLLQSVIEGTCYQSRWILEYGFPQKITNLVCTGGSTASSWWMQCKANILNKEVIVSDIEEGTLAGAVALMQQKNALQQEIRPKVKKIFYPQKQYTEAYEYKYLKKFLPAAAWISSFSVES